MKCRPDSSVVAILHGSLATTCLSWLARGRYTLGDIPLFSIPIMVQRCGMACREIGHEGGFRAIVDDFIVYIESSSVRS
jgi:hypothetical protein